MTPSLTATMTETPTASPTWIETLVATITGETLTPSPTVKPDDALATPTVDPTLTFPVMPGIELTPALAFPSPEALALDLEPEQPLPVLESTDFRDPHDVDWEFTEPVMEPSADGTYWLHFRTPYAVRARLPDQNNVTLTLNLRMTGGRVSIRTHYNEGIGYYRFSLSADGLLELARGEVVVASVRLVPVQPEHWRSLRLAVTGRSLRASIDGAMVLHYVDRAPLPPGQVWMAVDGIPTGEVWIDNVQMTGSTPRAEIAPPPMDMSAASMNLSPLSTQPVVVFDRLMNATTGDHNMFRMNIDGSGLVQLPNNTL
ncbi:MAG: hypothetical protein SF123_06625, partial [Chloroflexota bacterium]|nr:hypothetical protein [Chloroflexota bacterium]